MLVRHAIISLPHHVAQLGRKSCLPVLGALHRAADPRGLLRTNGCRGRDRDVGVNKEEDEDLAVTGLCRVREAERRDEVLVDVRKSNASLLFGNDIAHVLRTGFKSSATGPSQKSERMTKEKYGYETYWPML